MPGHFLPLPRKVFIAYCPVFCECSRKWGLLVESTKNETKADLPRNMSPYPEKRFVHNIADGYVFCALNEAKTVVINENQNEVIAEIQTDDMEIVLNNSLLFYEDNTQEKYIFWGLMGVNSNGEIYSKIIKIIRLI